MRSLILYLVYYALAVLLGFILRTRFDAWLYSRPHMQRRLVVYCSDVVAAVQEGAESVAPPPLTVDTDAVGPLLEGTMFSRFVRQTEADRRLALGKADEEPPADPVAGPAPADLSDAAAAASADPSSPVVLSGSPPVQSDPYHPS